MANAVPGTGTTPTYVQEGQKMLRLAASRCPNTKIMAGGYSYVPTPCIKQDLSNSQISRQGAALMAEAVARLDSATKSRINGVVLYGWIENSRNDGRIKGFPTSKTKIFCYSTDTVCYGALVVTPAHFVYQVNGDASSGANFLISRVNR
jgi:cutinase